MGLSTVVLSINGGPSWRVNSIGLAARLSGLYVSGLTEYLLEPATKHDWRPALYITSIITNAFPNNNGHGCEPTLCSELAFYLHIFIQETQRLNTTGSRADFRGNGRSSF